MYAGRTIFATAALASASAFAAAQAPLGTAISYQGQLKTSSNPANGSHDLRFTLYDAVAGGNIVAGPVCSDNVIVANGLFTVTLDFGSAAFDGDALWLAIEVRVDATAGNCSTGAYQPLSPRQPLTATPHALGLRLPYTASASVQSGAPMRAVNTFPGPLFLASGIWGESMHPAGRGVYGLNTSMTGVGSGVYGESRSTTGYGVIGFGNSTSGANAGVFGRSDSATGSGVFGRAFASAGETYGVQGRSDSQNGYGVYGIAAATGGSNCGVFGQSNSPDGCGVKGFSQDRIGVVGRSYNNIGVLGQSLTLSGESYGVVGECVSAAGGRGVYGHALNTAVGSTYGVYGEATGISGFAVWFQGRFAGSGTKSFRIDHPADPQNKYLMHYCAEGPEPLNVYRGTVVLDDAGEAWVTLPAYFSEINRDAGYTLTPIGAAAPNLHVRQKVEANRFLIAGGQPGQEISWRVEAVRNDRWVREYGAPVVIDKPVNERGKYQDPELFGVPAEAGAHSSIPVVPGTNGRAP